MKIGYARVSTIDQNPRLQETKLKEAGCDRIFVDYASGAHTKRPQLDLALSHLRPGDTLIVWRLDRLGRDRRHLNDVAAQLKENNIQFQSLTENIDTSTIGGDLIYGLFAAFADFERNLIVERTKAGLAAARARGQKPGPDKRELTKAEYEQAATLLLAGHSAAKVARLLGMSRTSLYRHFPGGRAALLQAEREAVGSAE